MNEMALINRFLKERKPKESSCILGCVFMCCTAGLSFIPFAYQLSNFESCVNKYFQNLNSKYRSKHLTWELVPALSVDEETYVSRLNCKVK